MFVVPNEARQDPFQPKMTPAETDFRSGTVVGDPVDYFQEHGGLSIAKPLLFVSF